MPHYTCYLKKYMLDTYIESMFGDIFEYDCKEVGKFLCDGNHKLWFENSLLEGYNEFNSALTVYIADKKKVSKLGIYNSLLFGTKISNYTKEEVVVSDESDDPYQWILVRGSQIFLVEELATEGDGITLINSNSIELSYDKALALLPGKGNLEDPNYNSWSFSISPSSLWNNCVKYPLVTRN